MRVHIFDVDFTLVGCSTVRAFILRGLRQGLIGPSIGLYAPLLFARYAIPGSPHESEGRAYPFLRGVPRWRLEDLARELFDKLFSRRIDPRVVERVDSARRGGGSADGKSCPRHGAGRTGPMLDLAAIALVGYILGSIPFGVIAGKLAKGIDLRERGSGNTGATNSFRVLGWKLGSLVAVADIAKGYAAVALASRIHLPWSSAAPFQAAFMVATLAAALGHMKPVFARFRGGRGFGTAAGAIAAAYPIVAPFCLAVFLVALVLTGYVALCAVAASLALPFIYLIAAGISGVPIDPAILAFFFAAFALTTLGVRKKLVLYFKGEAELFAKVMIFKPR